MNTNSPLIWFSADVPMGPITLEEGPTHPAYECPCCGRSSIRVHGYLYRDERPCAVYFVDWVEGHVENEGVDMILSVGEWGVDIPNPSRWIIPIRCRISDGFAQFMVLDAIDHGIAQKWDSAEFLGTFMRREAALRHPEMPEVFHLAEHVVEDDRRVNAALRGEPRFAC